MFSVATRSVRPAFACATAAPVALAPMMSLKPVVYTNSLLLTTPCGARGMATGKQLKNRIKTVTNIRKITKAMKMVAAAKLRSVQSFLEQVRFFQKDIAEIWPESTADKTNGKKLLVVMSSDRGLCGGVNTVIARAVRKRVLVSDDANIFVIGEKGKAVLERYFGRRFTTTVSDAGKQRPVTFLEVSLVAEHILAQPFDHATIYYNQFKSAIAYDTTEAPLTSLQASLENREYWNKYQFEGDKNEILRDLYEFRLACRLFHYSIESATSEQSARMTAMDNSSKNAGEMLEKLRLMFNRSRQAKITTELIEIISGAAALGG